MIFPLFALLSEAPPVSPLGAVLQTLLVAGGAFVVIAAVLSHLRYQAMVKEALEKETANADELCLLLVERMAVGPFGLLWLAPASGSLHAHRETLLGALRKDDQCHAVEGGALLFLLEGAETPGVRLVAHRLRPHFASLGGGGGVTLTAWPPETPVATTEPPNQMRLRAAELLLQDLTPSEAPPQGEWSLPELPPALPPVIPDIQLPLLDPLTRVLRADRVDTSLQKLLASHRRRETPAAVLMVGIDGLGVYNETLGREAGDAVLRGVADTLMLHCRETDLIGRPGGDEFLIFMPATAEQALAASERMSAAVREAEFTCGTETLRCTVGVGVVAYPDHGAGPARLFALARMALDAARGRGRGVCLLYDPSLRPVAVQRSGEPEEGPDTF